MSIHVARRHRPSRRAATMVLAVLMITVMLGLVAFAVDLGYIYLVRTQLQVAADVAAMSAASELMDAADNAISTAQDYAGRHVAGGRSCQLNAGDVELGRWNFGSRTFGPAEFDQNAIRVLTRCDETTGGEHPMFFSNVFGISSNSARAEAVAAFVDNFNGFGPPSNGENSPILPLVLDEGTYELMQGGAGTDEWTWNPDLKEVTPGPDGIPEANFYPEKNGAAGNRGAVDIGRKNSGAAALATQIRDGLTADELDYHGGSLSLGDDGTLELGGKPGMNASIIKELEAIKGKPRIVPIFRKVSGNGRNAKYTIVKFAGVRVLETNSKGNDKRVIIQPARVIVRGGIPADGPNRRTHDIFSAVSLVR